MRWRPSSDHPAWFCERRKPGKAARDDTSLLRLVWLLFLTKITKKRKSRRTTLKLLFVAFAEFRGFREDKLQSLPTGTSLGNRNGAGRAREAIIADLMASNQSIALNLEELRKRCEPSNARRSRRSGNHEEQH